MSQSSDVRVARLDAWANQAEPAKTYADEPMMRLKSAEAFAYLRFGLPRDFKPTKTRSVTVVSAVLRVYTRLAWGVTPTLTAQRISEQWGSRLNWNNKPAVTGATATVSHSSAVDGDEFAIDVTALMQTIANGADWYGLRIATNNATLRAIYSSDSPKELFRPTLEITWSEAPRAPSRLSPSGGRVVSIAKPVVSCNFTDRAGSTAMQSIRVQANPTNVWTDPAYDSGVVSATEPELDLATASYVRTVSVTKTNGSPTLAVVAGALSAADVGATITGTGIPGGATITAATLAGTSATMSANASSPGTITATVTRTFATVADGSTMFWRVQVQDGAGLWSDWSDPTSWKRDAKGTLTITNPAASPNNFVSEWTPPISWTLTGETQRGYQVIITPDDDRTNYLYDSGRTKGTDNSLTLPKAILTDDSAAYYLIMRTWDTDDREHTPGDPPYTEATRTFTFVEDSTPAAPSSISALQLDDGPYVRLTFVRSTAPDSFTVMRRDGGSGPYKVVDSGLDPVDLFVSGTTYQYTDHDADANRVHRWKVQAVVNHESSQANPTVDLTNTTTGIWIYDADLDLSVFVNGGLDSDFEGSEQSTWFDPLGASRGILVTQGIQGLIGKISGSFEDKAGATAQTWTDRMNRVKGRAGKRIRLTLGSQSFPALLNNIVIWPFDDDAEDMHVSFEFRQVGNLPFRYRG